jgi:NifU-like protein involved in Fe-S cluster formation
MVSALYTTAILRLAASLIYEDHLENPSASADVRSPLCGSRMSIDIEVDDHGLLQKIAFRVNSCALGQASAAIVGKYAIGQNVHAIRAIREDMSAFLSGIEGTYFEWPELNEFAIASRYPARHGAILLPFDAVLAAYEKAA